MTGPRKLFFATILTLVAAGLASASQAPANIYFAQTAQGSSNGADCADAYAYNDGTHGINQSASWVAGNTLHICGIITLPAGTNFITARASGSSTSPITIQFEANSIFQEPYFGSGNSSGINLNGNSYITITSPATGSAGAGTLSGYGTIQAYSNGTQGALACTGTSATTAPGSSECNSNVVTMSAIYAIGSNYVTLSNMNCSNMYVITAAESTAPGGAPGNDCFQGGGEAVTVSNNIMSYDGLPVDLTYPYCTSGYGTASCSNTYISGNYFSSDGWGVGCAPGNVTNYYVHDNHFTNFVPWTYAAGGVHVNGIHCYDLGLTSTSTSGGIQNFYLYNNLFDGNMGTTEWTAWVYLEADWGGCGSGYWTNSTGTAYVWNNIFAGSLDIPNARLDICAGTGHEVLNNVFYAPNATNSGRLFSMFGNGSATGMFENNVFEGSDQAFYISGLKSITADYNIYANLNGGNPYFIALSYGGNSFSAWQSSCSCDSHSQAQLTSALADFTSEGIPIAGFVGLKYGVNLTSDAAGSLATLNTGTTVGASLTGQARPTGTCSTQGSSSCWDIGAYEISNGTANLLPNPPTGLAAVVQ
ncbi:MAG: hypothetical protein WA555_12850 [Candidatus Sulfotelmatobacter sp.]